MVKENNKIKASYRAMEKGKSKAVYISDGTSSTAIDYKENTEIYLYTYDTTSRKLLQKYRDIRLAIKHTEDSEEKHIYIAITQPDKNKPNIDIWWADLPAGSFYLITEAYKNGRKIIWYSPDKETIEKIQMSSLLQDNSIMNDISVFK